MFIRQKLLFTLIIFNLLYQKYLNVVGYNVICIVIVDRGHEMKTAIVAILLLIIILNVLAISFRRKHINRIKVLENRKTEIQHKPIFEEMAKIKQLNMTGETEKKFESWRAAWTEVIDIHMLEIDNLFFDAEEQIDHFKVNKIKETISSIESKIDKSETTMNDILSDLDLLIGSEEKNRVEMETLQEQRHAARKKILAHQPAFGATVDPLEKELEAFNPKLEEYETLTNEGNYIQAREIVIELKEKSEWLFPIIEILPALLTDIQNAIPASIKELRNGISEMEEQSYYLGHLELTEKLVSLEDELKEMLVKSSQLEMDGIQGRVNEIHEELDDFYDSLEAEVIARHAVEDEYEQVHDELQGVTGFIKDTLNEVTYIQQSYRLPEQETAIPRKALDEIEQANKKFAFVTLQINEHSSAYSTLQEEIKTIRETTGQIEEKIKAFAERIKNLRNDEHKVRKVVEMLTKELHEIDRSLHRGNIPGIPGDIDARLDEAEEQLYIVRQSLQEIPLNMTLIYSYLDNAKKSVQEVKEKTVELLENVVLIEQIIQYGNRYRASNERVHKQLQEAEESFRQFRYAKALEESATAVEAAEPGAMKRIEELLAEQEGQEK